MMNKFYEYTQNAVDFARPYVKEVGGYASNAADYVDRKIKSNTRKAKRSMKIIKFKNYLEVISNVVLIIASLIALFVAIKEWIKSSEL